MDRYSVGELLTGFTRTEAVAICEESGNVFGCEFKVCSEGSPPQIVPSAVLGAPDVA